MSQTAPKDRLSEDEEDDQHLGLGWVLRALWPLVRTHSKTAALLVIALTGQLVATVALALALASLIDGAIPSRDADQVIRVVLALLAVLALCALAAFVQAHLLARLSSEVVFDLQRRLLDHILRLPTHLLDRTRSGDMLARFSSDLAPVAEAVGVGGPRLVMYTMVVSGCLAAIAWIDWRAAAGTILLFGSGALLSRGLPGRAARATRTLKETEAKALSLTAETIRNQKLLRVFGLQRAFAERFAVVAREQRAARARAAFRLHAAEMLADYGAMSLIAIAIGCGSLLAIYGYVSAGALVAIFTLLVYIQDGVYEMAYASSSLLKASGGLARIRALLAADTEEQEDDDAPALVSLTGQIAFEDIAASYDGATVFSGLSLTVERGQHVAIVGRSGSGKSTLLRLLMRLKEPSAGRVTWDGTDIATVSRHSLRAQLGVVFQDPLIIGATVREAVRLGHLEATDEEVDRSLAAAALDVASLTQGAATPLGEDGHGLSGGQKQRLALARALVRRPSLLILDEVTAALDPEAEARIVETVNALPKQQTVISVTHRLSVARSADRIIVLDAGQIVEDGTHDALIEADGTYAALYQHQSVVTFEDGRLQVVPGHLRRVALFSETPEDVLVALANAFEAQTYEAGAVIIREGDPAEAFFIVHRGQLEALAAERVFKTFEDGDCFGEIGLLLDIPHTATVRAIGPATCLRLDRDNFSRLVIQDANLEKALFAMIRRRIDNPRYLLRSSLGALVNARAPRPTSGN